LATAEARPKRRTKAGGSPELIIKRKGAHAWPTNANSTELARRYRGLGGIAEIVLIPGLPANKRGHDGPELYESARLLTFLLAD